MLTGGGLGILLFTLVGTVYAGGPGTTAANFLKIGVGARATAMGGAFTALADDSTSLYWNPAGLARVEEGEISAMYNMWFEGVHQGYLSLVFPPSVPTMGFGVNYVTMRNLEGRDESGNFTETFEASDLHIFAGFAGKIGKLLLGLSAGTISSTIFPDSETATLGTVGGLFEISEGFSVGVAAQNLGTKLGEDSLPLILKAGLALKRGSLSLAADIGKPQDADLYYCAGIEGWIGETLALRAGYKTNQDIGPGYTAGLGLKMDGFGLDYAYVPYGDLGTTHRVSVVWK